MPAKTNSHYQSARKTLDLAQHTLETAIKQGDPSDTSDLTKIADLAGQIYQTALNRLAWLNAEPEPTPEPELDDPEDTEPTDAELDAIELANAA